MRLMAIGLWAVLCLAAVPVMANSKSFVCVNEKGHLHCENHYIHSFELENGRIKRNREFMNPIQKLRALGIAVPQIKRDGIPT